MRKDGKRVFVVHEHHARRLHYDFRLEMAGVLKSWAIPKGPSMNPSKKRLAVMVDDHPLAYADFEGIIPPGHYGAGTVIVWDSGTYRLIETDDPVRALEGGKLVFDLKGNILRGRFTLLQMKGKDQKHWLLIKTGDAYSHNRWTLKQVLTQEKKASLQQRRSPDKPHRCQELGLPMK